MGINILNVVHIFDGECGFFYLFFSLSVFQDFSLNQEILNYVFVILDV